MAKIVRYNGNLVPFASSSLGTERTLFGEVTQANDITSQFTADFLRGWGIVGPSDQPTLQDFNAVSYTHGQILAYLHQVGLPEYNAAQEYHINSLCNSAGIVYVSLINANVGNTPASSPSQWKQLYEKASQPEVTAGVDDIKYVTSLKLQQKITSLVATKVTKITATGTFTPTAGMKFAFVQVQAAGGGGGGSTGAGTGAAAASGGSAGGYSEGYLTAAAIGASQAVTIGTGGIGGTSGVVNGTAGTASSFGALLTATGGSFGGSTGNSTQTVRGAPPNPSGGGSGNTQNGQNGQIGTIFGPTVTAIAGSGGSSRMGVGGAGRNEGSDGFVGHGYGSGGAGAASSNITQIGGAGAPGVIIVTEYF